MKNRKPLAVALVVVLLAIKIFAIVLVIWAGVVGAIELIKYHLVLPQDWYILGAYFVVMWLIIVLLLGGGSND